LVTNETNKPILFVDVDGVISLFGFAPGTGQLPGPLHWVDGVAHCIPGAVGQRLVTLAESFELVWATGWEETANEHLPHLLGLPGDLPCLTFNGNIRAGAAMPVAIGVLLRRQVTVMQQVVAVAVHDLPPFSGTKSLQAIHSVTGAAAS
jgi:hypothetical protein